MMGGMSIKLTTPVPNSILDQLLPHLSMAELKVLLVIIRQTKGWRKKRDWITQSQFIQKTGLSRQTISQTLAILQHHKLISITDRVGVELQTPESRKGKSRLYYTLCDLQHVGLLTLRCKVSHTTPVGLSVQDKRNSTKESSTKGIKSIGEILKGLFG